MIRSLRKGALHALLALGLTASAVRGAGAGDVAVIQFSSDNPDSLSFVVLNVVPSGTEIRFTDSGWQTSDSFRANEGGISYTAATTLTPGTVVSMSNPFTSGGWLVNNSGLGGGGFSLSASGDQILTFVGSASSPTFLHAVHFASTGYNNATSSNTTGLPPGLTVGGSAVDLGDTDNGYYSGPTTGSAASLLSEIGNPSNWTLSDNSQSLPSWNFVITGSQPALASVTLPGTTFNVNDMVVVTATLSTAPEVGSPVTVMLTSGAMTSPQTIMISNPATSGTANVTLANSGVWNVSGTVTVGGTGSVNSADFTVGSTMNPPVADAGPDRSVILSAATVMVTIEDAFGDDIDGLAGATYAWTPASGAGIVGWLNRTGAMNTSVAPGTAAVTLNQVGVYTFTLTVTDDDGMFDSDSMSITVSNPIPTDLYDPPPTYYDGATSTGSTLKMQLSTIMANGHVQQTYGDYRDTAARYDADPGNAGKILLIYNRDSIPGAWGSGSSWNREHVWPQSRQPGDANNGTTGNLGDPFALRPADPGINSSRGNKPFGNYTTTGGYGSQGSNYFPGDADKGDVARACFYSATRYMSTLTLVNGTPSGNQMGDLASMLRWHYTDVPDTFERRRNQLIFEDQHNRNAFIDRPEFVWTIFGDGANDSTLHLTVSPPVDGTSNTVLNLPNVIVGGPLPSSSSVTLRKSGNDPTFYSVAALGDATSSVLGRYNAFDYGSQQLAISVGLAASTASSGVISGALIIDNLDVSSEGSGQGSADGDDVIDIELTVLDHADASFSNAIDLNTLVIDFGTVATTDGVQSQPYTVFNLASPSGYTANLRLTSVNAAGSSGLLTTDVAPFAALSAGSGNSFDASFDPTAIAPGNYTATYTLNVADATLPGGISGAPLTLILEVDVADVPVDSDGDGVPDNLDLCPGTPGGIPVDCDGRPLRDANLDCALDFNDVALIVAELLNNAATSPQVDDADGDGIIDAMDICPGTPTGIAVNCDGRPLRDVNGDCVVDGDDIAIIVAELVGA